MKYSLLHLRVLAALAFGACGSLPSTEVSPADSGITESSPSWPPEVAPDRWPDGPADGAPDTPTLPEASAPERDGGPSAAPDAAADASVEAHDGGPGEAAADPEDVAGNPAYALVATYLGGVSAFAIDPVTGALAPVPDSPFDRGAKLLGVAVHPSGAFIHVTDFGAQRIDGYRFDPTSGSLTSLPAARFAFEGAQPIAIAVEPKGRFLYVTTLDSAFLTGLSLHGFAVDAATGALSRLAGSPFVVSPTTAAGTLAIEPSGRFLYHTSAGAGVRGFSIDASGALHEIAGSPFGGTGVGGGAMAFHPGGAFMYNAGRDLNGFRVDAQTGALTSLPGSPFATGVGSDPTATPVAVDPRGRYVYVTTAFTAPPATDTVSAYAIDAATGALTAVPGSPFPARAYAYSVATDPSGRFVYVGNDDSDLVSAYSVDQTSGALSPVSGSPFPVPGLQPEIVTLSAKRR
jgi:DNA-binding beta-propeller fold protein YncE